MRNDFETNYLAHWGLKKGAQKEDHKYYARIDLPSGKYRYFYTMAEYKAYLGGKVDDAKDKLSDIKSKINELLKRGSEVTQETIDKGKTLIDKKINPGKYKTIKDLSTNNARNEKTNAKKHQADISKQNTIKKDLNTVPIKEKQALREKARKQERINAALERDRARHKKEKEDLAKITEKQAKRKSESLAKKILENAKKWFCKDAKDSAKEDYSKHPELKIKDKNMSKDEDMAAVNRNLKYTSDGYEMVKREYKKETDPAKKAELRKMLDKAYDDYYNWSTNCADCTLMYDMRRRGYDVTAARQSKNRGWSDNVFYSCYKEDLNKEEVWANARKYYTEGNNWWTSKTVYKELNSHGHATFDTQEIQDIKNDMLNDYPEGSYGYLAVAWDGGGSHACIWSVENGDVVIRDAQTNSKVDLDKYLEDGISYSRVRLDNKTLSDKAYEYAQAEVLEGDTIVRKKGGR